VACWRRWSNKEGCRALNDYLLILETPPPPILSFDAFGRRKSAGRGRKLAVLLVELIVPMMLPSQYLGVSISTCRANGLAGHERAGRLSRAVHRWPRERGGAGELGGLSSGAD
jgi:hypothetical protein